MYKKFFLFICPILVLLITIITGIVTINRVNNYYNVYHYYYKNINIDVYLDKEEYNENEEISIRVEVTNTGNRDLIVRTNYDQLSKLVNISYKSVTIDYNQKLNYEVNNELINEISFESKKKIIIEKKFIANKGKSFQIVFDAIINNREVKIEKIVNVKVLGE